MLWVMNTTVFGRLRQNDGDLALQLLAGDGVERAERLVEQQHVRIERERARDADPLLHAAGQFVRIMVGEAVESDEPDEALGALAICAAGSFATSSPKATLRATVSQGNRLNC